MRKDKILQFELQRLPIITVELLSVLTSGGFFGKKENNYFILNTHTLVSNFEQSLEVDVLNECLKTAFNQGYTFLMIKI